MTRWITPSATYHALPRPRGARAAPRTRPPLRARPGMGSPDGRAAQRAAARLRRGQRRGPRSGAGPRERGAVEAALVLLEREREERIEVQPPLAGTGAQLGVAARRRRPVPGADGLAIVAPEGPWPQPLRDRFRDGPAPLDRLEGDA